jgi:vanillate O-demethylase ferredoxin subunit
MSAGARAVWQDGRVATVDVVAERVARIVIEPSRPVPVDAGAHVDIALTIGGSREVRSYSILQAAPDGSSVTLSVLLTEASRGGSAAMHALEPGDRVRMTQPLQHFPLSYSAARYELLAGGIGITAIAPMARQLRETHRDYHLLYVGRARSRMPYADELREEHGDRITILTRSDGGLQVDQWVESTTPGADLYMCGPIRLMSEVRAAWLAAGRSIAALRTETFGSSGWFSPTPFEVRVPRLGLTVTVPANTTILEALERAGADVMSDCRRGECGLCEMRVRSLSGDIDHRDVFYSERQKDARSKLCACVSRVVPDTRGVARICVDMS